jgi:hypothetical protein
MNTKSLLLIAALATAGASSAFGQVTSQNIVGYIRLNLRAGFNLISNQLSSGNNDINTVLAGAPDDSVAYKWTGTSFNSVERLGGTWEVPSGTTFTLSPGEGFFLRVPAATTITFVGEVSLNNSVALRQGFTLIASPLPLSGRIGDPATVGFVAAEDDTVFQWTGSAFASTQYIGGAWETSDGNAQGPNISVGEGFFIQSNTARNYVRNFTVN